MPTYACMLRKCILFCDPVLTSVWHGLQMHQIHLREKRHLSTLPRLTEAGTLVVEKSKLKKCVLRSHSDDVLSLRKKEEI